MTVTSDAIEWLEQPERLPIRRDQWGRYKVLPPGGKKPVGYARATTIKSAIEDTANLQNWACRMTALGLAHHADLLAKLRLCSADDRKAIDSIVDQAKTAGGADIRRDLGTAFHEVIERACTDPTFIVPDAYVADVQAFRDTLAAAGLEVVDQLSERMVVWHEHQIAGMFDLVLRDETGQQYIADLKTGSTVTYGALGFSAQLAIYANADGLYTQGAAADGSQDILEPMPDVSKSAGVIIHLQPETGVCDLYWLDLEVGLEAVELALQVRAVRKAKPLTKIVPLADYPPSSVAGTDSAGSTSEPVVNSQGNTLDMRREWMQERIDVIKVDERRRMDLARLWPTDIPTLKASTAHTDHELEQIIHTLDQIEAIYQLPFNPEPIKAVDATPKPTHWTPEPIELDEGDPIDDSDINVLRSAVEALHVGRQNQIKRWFGEAAAQLRPFSGKGEDAPNTVRRFNAMRAAIALSQHDDQTCRELLGDILGDLPGAMKTGTAIGTLTTAQAELCAVVAQHLADGNPIGIDHDGQPTVLSA